MLKVLDAIEFTRVFTKGGRTEPWLIQVAVEGERVPYVVKLFKEDEVDMEHTVAREVFGTILAQEFDLSVPEPALIYFSPAFNGDHSIEILSLHPETKSRLVR